MRRLSPDRIDLRTIFTSGKRLTQPELRRWNMIFRSGWARALLSPSTKSIAKAANISRQSALGLVLILAACGKDAVEGTYHTDDGEGSSATMILEDGNVQFWQGDTALPPMIGSYRLDDDGQVILTLGDQVLTLTLNGECLHPSDDPSQTICKT
ncbi:hypothetical protein JJJ17_04055 [Paracoccus caeni]|uniref:Uncharacterized protein n=1 Tax=Paracoccus caeni TaxID=657651 RepID=A0A934SD12_9RHOB|nr:hypothetical protein [Paracoccus caeni]MBK4215095.1 hypothetical protein [Paracoccus caeni]